MLCKTSFASLGQQIVTNATLLLHEGENEEQLSQGAVAGISVSVTAIVATLSFIALWFIVNVLRRNSQDSVSERTVSANDYNNPPFRRRHNDKSTSGRETVSIGGQAHLSSLPCGSAESEYVEMETRQIYDIVDVPEQLHESPAYAGTGAVHQTGTGIPTSEPIYDETGQ